MRSGSINVIVASEVIEHLENPRSLLRDVARLLRPDGILVLTTPNNESIRSLLSLTTRGSFAAFGESSYPAHITPVLRIDLARVVDEAGLSCDPSSFLHR